MGYDVAAIAKLELPPGEVAAWKRRKADSSAFSDWPQPLIPIAAPPASVSRVLEEVKAQLRSSACGLRIARGRVELAAVMPEHVFTEQGARLVTAFRIAAAFGAHGRVDFTPFWTDGPAYGFTISPEDTRVVYYSDEGIEAVARSAPYRWLEASMEGVKAPLPEFGAGWLQRIPDERPAERPAAAAPRDGARAASSAEDLIVSGRVGFRNQTTLRKWNRAVLSPAAAGGSPLGVYTGDRSTISPDDLARALQEMDPPVGALRLSMDPIEVWVKAAIAGRDVTTWAPLLIAAFREASRFDGEGHLWLLPRGVDAPGGLIVDIASGSSQLRAATTDDWSAAQKDELHADAARTFGYYLP